MADSDEYDTSKVFLAVICGVGGVSVFVLAIAIFVGSLDPRQPEAVASPQSDEVPRGAEEPRPDRTTESDDKPASPPLEQTPETATRKGPPRAVGPKIDKTAAWVMAQQFVVKFLKSPSTASFGGLFSGDYQRADDCVTSLGNGKYRVKGWVDSQNGFGATVRTDFVLTVRDNGDGGTWSLVDEPIFVKR